MLFDYKAIDRQGKKHRGQLVAAHLADLEHRLQRLDLELIAALPSKSRPAPFRRRFPRRPLINFWFHLEHLLRAGVPLVEGLRDLQASSDPPALHQTVGQLVASLEGGQPLSQALREHPQVFDGVTASLVQAGETSGHLIEVIVRIQDGLKWEDELASQTQKLVLYPAFLAISVLSAMAFMLAFVVPQLKEFIVGMGHPLPWHTRLLFILSDLLREHAGVAICLLLVPSLLLAALPKALTAGRLSVDGVKLRLPFIGEIIQKIVLSRFAATLAMLYAAGIPVLEALENTKEAIGNRAIHDALTEAENAVRNGRNIAEAFAGAALFPPLVVRMLKVGESTGSLDTALRNVSYFYNREVQELIGKAQALIEPAMTLGIGVLLAWLMLAVLGPIYDIVARATA